MGEKYWRECNLCYKPMAEYVGDNGDHRPFGQHPTCLHKWMRRRQRFWLAVIKFFRNR